jgi:DNA-binding response OmpR family regulator
VTVPQETAPLTRLLVVDDEESIGFALKEYLEQRGFQVDHAGSAADARALAAQTRYELVIADLRLSAERQTEGLELLAWFRESRPETRTLLLTAYGSPETEQEARRIGVDAVLQKTQDLDALARLLRRLARPPG